MTDAQGAQQTNGPKSSHGLATASLFTGIAAIPCCGFPGPIALILGLIANNQIKAEPGKYKNEKHAIWGIVLGGIGTAILVFAIIAQFVAPDALPSSDIVSTEPSTPTPEQAAPSQPSQPAPKPVRSVIDVSARELIGAYKGNEIRADAQFKDKLVRITGRVGDVKKDILDTIYVTIGTGRQYELRSIQCYFEDEHTQSVMNYDKGDRITVTGRVDGLMMNVLVKECEVMN